MHVLQQHLLGAWEGRRVQRLGLLRVRRAHGHMLHAHALGRGLGGARVGGEIARGDGEDPLELVSEAGLEHRVHLVDDHVPHVAEVDVVLVEVLQQPPRCRHEQVDRLLEHALLRALGHAAVHGRHADLQRPAQRARHVAHLQRQLARGKQHERTRPARPRTRAALLLVRPERLHDGQEVSEGLARAGPRADEHVGPAGERWHHPPLQIVRLCDAHFLERVTELAAEAELGERRGDGGGCRRAPMGHARLCERRRQLVRAREGDGRRQHDDERTSRPNFSHAAR